MALPHGILERGGCARGLELDAGADVMSRSDSDSGFRSEVCQDDVSRRRVWCAAITSGLPFVLGWARNLSPGVEGRSGSGARISEDAVSGREFWFLGWRGDNGTRTIAHLPCAAESS